MDSDDDIAMRGDLSARASGLRARAFRKMQGLSLTAMGSRIGVVEGAVRSWEAGKNYAPVFRIAPMAWDAGVTLDFLYFGEWRSLSAGRWVELRRFLIEVRGA